MVTKITTPESKIYSSCREAITLSYFQYKSVFDRVYDPKSLRRDASTLGDPDALEHLVEHELNRPEKALANILYEFNAAISDVERKHGLVGTLASGGRGHASKGLMNAGVWGTAIGCALRIPYLGLPIGVIVLGCGHSIYRDYLRRECHYNEDTQKKYADALGKMHGLAILQEITKAKENLDSEGRDCLNEICMQAGIDLSVGIEEAALSSNGSLIKLSNLMSVVKPMFSWVETTPLKNTESPASSWSRMTSRNSTHH
ncbi:MAG: hypothetical protein AABX47_03080 [Nanoarchaeota archaeon]